MRYFTPRWTVDRPSFPPSSVDGSKDKFDTIKTCALSRRGLRTYLRKEKIWPIFLVSHISKLDAFQFSSEGILYPVFFGSGDPVAKASALRSPMLPLTHSPAARGRCRRHSRWGTRRRPSSRTSATATPRTYAPSPPPPLSL